MNIKQLTKVTLLTIFFMNIYSCDDTDFNSNPNSEYELSEAYGNYLLDTLYAIKDSVIQKPNDLTYDYSKLSIGNFDGIKTSFVLKFIEYPFSIDSSVTIDSAKLEMTTFSSYGRNVEEQLRVNMYNFLDTLNVFSINTHEKWRSPVSYNMELIDEVFLQTKDSAKSYIPIPLYILNDWMANEDLSGLYFEVDEFENGAIVEFSSSYFSLSQQPRLIYYYNSMDSLNNIIVEADTMYTVINGTIFNYEEAMGNALEKEEDKLLISSGIVRSSLLKFDFNSLSDNAIFYSSSLVLTKDEFNEYENPSASSNIIVRSMIEYDSSGAVYTPFTSYILIDGEKTYFDNYDKIFATEMLHGSKNNFFENKWLELSEPNYSREFTANKYYGSSASKELKPKIIVKYFNVNKGNK